MSWHDRLVPASLGDAPFFVERFGQDDGRRTYVQKFPGRAEVEVQDLGYDSREFEVVAFLIGDDYDLDRDLLEARLTEGGIHELTIPWRGTKDVTVIGRIRTEESKAEGGYCTITFRCVEAVPAATFQRVDTSAQLDTQADVAVAAAESSFSESFSVAGLPAANQTSSLDAFDAFGEALDNVTARASNAIGVVNSASAEVTEFTDDVEGLLTDVDALASSMAGVVLAGVSFAYTALEAAEAVATLPSRTRTTIVDAVMSAGVALVGFAEDFVAISTGSANGARESANRDVIVSTAQVMAAAELARACTQLPFDSRSQAERIRDQWVDAVDAVVPTLPDDVYDATMLLHARFVAYMEDVASTLPEVTTWEVPNLMSTSEIAHLLYGDGSRADEIEERNRLGAPLFVAGGTLLEVLTE